MSNYKNKYKVTAINYYHNYCYIEGIFDVNSYINTTVTLSIDSLLESTNDLAFTLLQINSSDLPKTNYFKEYFLLTSAITKNTNINTSKNINIKYPYLKLLLGVKLATDSVFTTPFNFNLYFTLKLNDIILSPSFFGGTVENISTIENLSTELVPPSDNSNNYASICYVDNEIHKITNLIPKIEVYSLDELDKIDKKEDIIYLGY